MGMELRQVLNQKLTLQEKLKQKMEISMRLKLSLENLRGEAGDSPEELLEGVLADFVESLDEGLREPIGMLFQESALKEVLLRNCENLTIAAAKGKKELKSEVKMRILEFLHKKHQGTFTAEGMGEEGRVEKMSFDEISLGTFTEAGMSPKAVSKEASGLQDFVDQAIEREGKDAELGYSLGRLGELKSALRVIELLKDDLDLLQSTLLYALVKPGEDGRTLKEFFQNIAVLRRLDYPASERLQNRFSNRFLNLKRNASPEYIKNALLNSIGEYVLICFGVIDPEIFVLQKGEIDPQTFKEMENDLKEMGIDLGSLMQRSNLKTSGKFFFQRWKTKETRATCVTDESIKEFLTGTIREDGEEILSLLDMDEFLRMVREINASSSTKLEKKNELAEIFTNMVSEEGMEQKLVELMKKKWFARLSVFYSPNVEEKEAVNF